MGKKVDQEIANWFQYDCTLASSFNNSAGLSLSLSKVMLMMMTTGMVKIGIIIHCSTTVDRSIDREVVAIGKEEIN